MLERQEDCTASLASVDTIARDELPWYKLLESKEEV